MGKNRCAKLGAWRLKMRVSGIPEVVCRLPKDQSMVKPEGRIRGRVAHPLEPGIVLIGSHYGWSSAA